MDVILPRFRLTCKCLPCILCNKSALNLQVAANKLWATVGRRFNPPSTMTDLSFVFKRNYVQALSAFEQVRGLQGPDTDVH